MHNDYDGWPPIMYHSAQNTPSGVQSGCATTYLAVSVPLVTLQGQCAFQNVDPVVMQHTGLPSSGLVKLYVLQVVCVDKPARLSFSCSLDLLPNERRE